MELRIGSLIQSNAQIPDGVSESFTGLQFRHHVRALGLGEDIVGSGPIVAEHGSVVAHGGRTGATSRHREAVGHHIARRA